MEAQRLFDLLTIQVEKNPDNNFLSGKYDGKWKDFTFAETQGNANRVSRLLMDLGLSGEDKIAIIGANSPEWNFADFGAMQVGLTVVPMYPTISEHDYEYIFNDAAIKYAFVGDEVILDKVKPLLDRCEAFKGIYTFKKIDGEKYFWNELPTKTDDSSIQSRKDKVDKHHTATIIYTSGTTGNPKGVMLSHNNIVSNIFSVKQVLPLQEGVKALSFLPQCHSFERTVIYSYLAFGIHIYFAESIETIGENLKEVKPYCFTTVPRLLEKIYEKIMATGAGLTGIKRSLFFWAMGLGAQYKLAENQGWWYNFRLRIARKLIFSKWQEALGGNVNFIVTGAAAMQPRLITLFTAAGVDVLEGYGLTETSPVLTCNRIPENQRCVGTVGMPIPGVDIKLAEDGEIIAKGENIMKGYYLRQDLTDEVIDKDGWFHTGDIGVWVEAHGNKFLKITDRKKELFKTAGGKYIAPQVIENKLKESRFVEQLMVVGGDDKKYISALIVPSFLQLEDWAKKNGITAKDHKKLVENPKVVKLLEEEVDKFKSFFGKWEQVKKINIIPHDWTMEGGELTPTLKLKRKNIYDKYRKEIESMYS